MKTAEKKGVSVRTSVDIDDLNSFCRMNVITRAEAWRSAPAGPVLQGNSPQPVFPWHGTVDACRVGRRDRGGVLYLMFRDTLTYKFNASDTARLDLRPNHLLMLRGLEMGCEEGYRYFDFGRSEMESIGLRAFKSQWGSI